MWFSKKRFSTKPFGTPVKNLDLESGMRLVVHTKLLDTSILAKIFPSDMSYIDEEIIAAPLIYRLCGVGPISKSGHAATICSATISDWIVLLGLNSCRCSDFKHQLIPWYQEYMASRYQVLQWAANMTFSRSIKSTKGLQSAWQHLIPRTKPSILVSLSVYVVSVVLTAWMHMEIVRRI